MGGATLNKFFTIFLMPGGRVGVALFFLISGYFQISKSTVSVKRVVEETIFYSIFLQVIALVLKIGSLGSVVRSFLPIASGSWWYVSSYILLMLCSPAINEYFKKLNRKQKIWSIHYNKIFKRVVQQNTKKPFAYDDHNMKTERN